MTLTAPDPPVTETPLSRALRRISQKRRLSSLDVPVLDDAADEIDELTLTVSSLRRQLQDLAQAYGVNLLVNGWRP